MTVLIDQYFFEEHFFLKNKENAANKSLVN